VIARLETAAAGLRPARRRQVIIPMQGAAEPREAGKEWHPRSIDELERLLAMASGFRALPHREIAESISADPAVFCPWLSKMMCAVRARPDVLTCLKHLLDLRAERDRGFTSKHRPVEPKKGVAGSRKVC
jgi:hypothetical protein